MPRLLLLLAALSASYLLAAQARLTTPGTAKPAFFVNGVSVENMNGIEPGNIESVDVFRGDEALKRFGSKAKDGAVLITTKKPVRLNYRDPGMTELWEPRPAPVTPGTSTSPPSDALVLFDGKNLDEWQAVRGGQAPWEVKDGAFTVTKGTGDIKTKRTFGDVQLHIEWRTPAGIESEGQGRGNSGLFLQERYELQILDSYENQTYANGQAGAVYKQHIPLVNASRAPGEWQTYDVIYIAPRFGESGRVVSPARITVLHNGVLIQNQVEIMGATEFIGLPKYTPHGKGAIQLQDHGNPVSFRNIWIREL